VVRAASAALVLALPVLAGCGASGAQSTILTWWVVPDRVDARTIADTCSSTADDYTIEIKQLPVDVDQRRSEIVRRLAAKDDSIDILTLDTSLTAEVAAAGYLAPIPQDLESEVTQGALPKAVEAATYRGMVVAAPWRLDPQVLWYRGTAAERAGIDTTKPVGWDALLAGAERLGTTLQIDDADGDGLAEWVRALVAGAGGQVVKGAGREPSVGISSEAGRLAAGIVRFYAGAGIGPGPSPDALQEFAGARGGFLVSDSSVIADPILAPIVSDMHAVPYPVVDGESVAPLSGASLAVPKSAPDTRRSFQAVSCLASKDSQQQMMIGSGHGAALASVHTASEVKTALPSDEIALKASATGVNVPITPYWQRVRAALRDTWTPITNVSPATTPAESGRAIKDLVAGGLR
jgi:multiple sugar transport system substrate-binding protein